MVIFSSNGAFIFLGERERGRRSLEASCCFFLAAPRSTLSSFWMSDYPYGIVASFPLLLLHSSSFRHLHLGFLSGLRRGHLAGCWSGPWMSGSRLWTTGAQRSTKHDGAKWFFFYASALHQSRPHETPPVCLSWVGGGHFSLVLSPSLSTSRRLSPRGRAIMQAQVSQDTCHRWGGIPDAAGGWDQQQLILLAFMARSMQLPPLQRVRRQITQIAPHSRPITCSLLSSLAPFSRFVSSDNNISNSD